MNWTDTQVLVTGAGGFIGSHLTEALVKRGASVRAFVRYNSAGCHGLLHDLAPQVYDAVEVYAGDIRSVEAMIEAMQGVDTVFHLAAQIAIPYSYQDPRTVVETNVLGTLNVAQAARRAGVRRMVHTSTSETYGTAQTRPINETHPLQAQSPYAASKIGADKLVESFHCSYDLPVGVVRPFNTFGPRQSARAVIPTIITQALAGGPVKLGSLHPTRDFTYVEDTAAGFIAMAEADEGSLGQVVNLGTGKTISIGDLVDVVGDVLGRTLEVEVEGKRIRPEKSEVTCLVSDNARAEEVMGWTPEHSLRDGLAKTIDWMRHHQDQYQADEYVT